MKVVRSAIFVVTFPGYSIIFPPAVSLTLMGSSFCGRMSSTIREYVTVHPTGILLRATKRIVFFPFLIFLEIRLPVFQIPLTIRFSTGISFILLLLSLDPYIEILLLCLDQ